MKMFLFVLFFGIVASAADKLKLEISSVNNPELNRVETVTRPADTMKVLDRNKKFIELGANDVICEVSFYEDIAVVGCEQTQDRKNRIIAESGFGVSGVVDCSKGDSKELSFSNKTKKSGKWAMFKVSFRCEREKT